MAPRSSSTLFDPRKVNQSAALTKRDLRISAWIDRLAGASIDQIQRRFDFGRSQAFLRLQILQDYGLVCRYHLLAGRPPLYVGRGRTVRPMHFEHSHLLTDVIIGLELADRHVVGEIEIRRQKFGELRLDDRLSPQQAGAVAECSRVPDAVEVAGDGSLIAYELELTSKGRKRREKILSTYAASGYAAVRWIVPDRQLAALLEREISAMGLTGFMEVSRELP